MTQTIPGRLSCFGSTLLTLILLLISSNAFAEYYRCTDPSGETVYSEAPCSGELDVITLTPSTPDLAILEKSSSGKQGGYTLDQAIDTLGEYRLYIAAWFLLPPLIALVLLLTGKRELKPAMWKSYLYSTLIYMVTIPGMLSITLIAYSLFFIQQNLLQVDLFTYFLPPIAMITTLILIGRNTSIKRLPSVDNIIGLMTILGIVFLILLLLLKTRIWIAFIGPMQTLLIIGIVLFFILRWGLGKLTR